MTVDAAPARDPQPRSRYDFTRVQLGELLADQPRYRVDQVWQGLYGPNGDPESWTNVPKALRSRLSDVLAPALTPLTESVSDEGDTSKWLWSLHDGRQIETVLMHYPDRSTVCISSQAGCAMACGFCATGQAGFDRHLSTGEIVEQVVRARARAAETGRRLSNVVFMGMGEPFANYDRTWAAVERINDDLGLGARHLTLSTVGVVPGIRRLTTESLQVNLAVSLHVANDDERDVLVPINRRYRLAELAEACADYVETTHRRLSFEWALIHGVNDTDRHGRELADYARPLRAHVNLIPLNPTPGYRVRGSTPDRVQAFARHLRDLGVNATIRRTRGTDIDAACGQLRATHSGSSPVELI
ncbi:MAG: 23S rRNA (adenine(2503)-C(2))-methyltransferase RlmN [Microthrixaceae bacterium]|nr:23S rRNA (adenine(2503)-C(2))-methyltransferase RlmN [Acidimicrobiales bacterium]MCB9404542.1 23S rRNA (adenine(2503)-C(2))-methyltransferase RlmN [Microthrixaceae bacterium]